MREGSPLGTGATLEEWLAWGRRLHPRDVVLETKRCAAVARRLGSIPPGFPIVTVAGTNGKGTCVALLESMLNAAGARAGAYLSPPLLRFSETVRVGGREVEDAALCAAFARVEAVREDIALTAFEFQSLAAMEALRAGGAEIAVLEIGMGGRDDAVNIFEPQIAVVTNVGIDHVRWLGGTREEIAFHKAGILRPGKPVVCGEREPPAALRARAAALAAPLYRLGRDFDVEVREESWTWRDREAEYADLPAPALSGPFWFENAAAAIMAMRLLPDRLQVESGRIARAMRGVELPGRQQVLEGEVQKVIDVAHNFDSVRALRSALRARAVRGRTLSVFAMLGDKDIAGATACLRDVMDCWFVSGLPGPRGLDARALAQRMAPDLKLNLHCDIASAYRSACAAARPGDRVVVWGSFHAARAAFECESQRVGG